MKTGITGATGQLGRLVVEKLKQRLSPQDLVGLVRSPEKATDLGIETRAFDYNRQETLTDSLRGIDQLLLISANEVGKRKVQHENVIKAAKEAGVKRLVYTSLLHADTSTLNLAEEHLATEQFLKQSEIPYTILRNGWYTENYMGSIPAAVSGGALLGSAEGGKISSATREDYAEAAAVVLAGKEHDGKTYELAGDQAFTLKDLAAEVSRQTGKEIPYNNLPAGEYTRILASFGLPEEHARMIAGWDDGISKNDLFDDGKELSALIGRPTTPLADTLKKNL
ncbi:MAG TPA: SDR family oxidoreductase [Anseongella sp.]